jgi:hypothetical protein
MRYLSPVTLALVLVADAFTGVADPIADTGQAVTAPKLHDSAMKGSTAARTPFREVAPDGGVLVGLEVGVGGTPPAERVAAVRAIYRVGGKNRTGSPAGHFLSEEVTRTVRLVAREGYAVGGVRVSAGKRIDGLSLRFLRVDERTLNPADAYESDWVGTARADGRQLVDSRDQTIVGLFGRLEGDVLLGLGLTFAEAPAPRAPEPTPAPKTVSTLPPPESPAEDPASSGNTRLAMLVFAVVAIPLGLIGIIAARQPRGRIQQLPRVVKSLPNINLTTTRPPAIPSELLRRGSRPPAPIPSTDAFITWETDAFLK